MKTCPYCAEEIKDAAIRCRWCLAWLVDEIPAGADTAPVRRSWPAEEPAASPEPIVQPVSTEPEFAAPEPAPSFAAPDPEPEPVPAVAVPEPEPQPVVATPAQVTPVEVAPTPVTTADTAPIAGTPVESPAAEPAAESKIEFTHTGARYLLGYGADYFGIWDRNAPHQPIERFPRNDEGWAGAWERYSAIETNWMDLRTGQKSS